jgi:predicted permease
MRQVIVLLSLTPMAVNTVVLATALKVKPEKAALGVLSTTLFALFFIPAVMAVVQ